MFNSREDTAEKIINNLENKIQEITEKAVQRGKMIENFKKLRDTEKRLRKPNTCITGALETKDSENGGNKELIAENFSKKGMNPPTQEQTKSQARF